MYTHAQYFSLEQIELANDISLKQAGEIWSLGTILYTLYQGEYPFQGKNDEEIVQTIITKPNNWKPNWREGLGEVTRSFILKMLEPNYIKRHDKSALLNDPFALQQFTVQQVIGDNRVLVQNIPQIYEIYAQECFIEDFLSYLSLDMNEKRFFAKLKDEIKKIDPSRGILIPLGTLKKAYIKYYGHDTLYVIHF